MNLNDKKDEILRRKMREQATDIPESYRDHIRTFTRELPDQQKKEKRNEPIYKVAAIFFAACLLCSGTCYAGVSLYKQRLYEMSKSERERLNNNTQKSEVDADAYSRELTDAENNMLAELQKDYESGKFPEEQLLTVERMTDVSDGTLLYCYENSTFYLPEKELSEQQMLEIIDFCYKRDYAIVQENQEKVPTNKSLICDTEEQELWESHAKNFMELFLRSSAQNIQYSAPKMADGDEESIELECSSKDWDHSYQLRMDTQTGEILEMGLDIDVEPYLMSGIPVNEQLYKSRGENLKKNAEDFYRKKVKKLTLYYNYVDGKLSRGNTKYAVCLEDDTTVVLMYSEKLDCFYSLYVTNYDAFKTFQNDSRKAAKMRGHKVKKVQLF